MTNFWATLFHTDGALKRLTSANAAQAQTIDALREDLERMILERDAIEALLKESQRERTTDEKITKLIVYAQQLEAKLKSLQLLFDGARESEHQAQTRCDERTRERDSVTREIDRLREDHNDLLAERDALQSMLTQALIAVAQVGRALVAGVERLTGMIADEALRNVTVEAESFSLQPSPDRCPHCGANLPRTDQSS